MKGFINNHKKLELITLLTLILSILIVIILELNSIGHEKSSIGVKKAIDEQISLLTTADEYEKMLDKCKKTVYNDYVTSSNVDTKIVVSDNTFADDIESSADESDTTFKQVDTIYCNNLLLVSFMNESGELKSVAATINNDTDKIEVVDINKISSFSGLNEYTSSEYLEKIGSNIVSIMESDKAKLDSTDADKLFTETGYKDLIAELDENNKINDISVSFIKIGKSNLDIGYYDRIIVQFTNNEDARNIYINTIIKIDKDGRIFDIDII